MAGEYGGDQWLIRRNVAGITDEVEYKDLRVMLGLESTTVAGIKAFAEIGYVFERELIYRTNMGNTDLDETLMVRGGLIY